MRVERRTIVNADRDTVWKVLSDPDRYPCPALPQRWETLNEGPVRAGARYTVLWKIGSIPVGGVAEVVEFDRACDLAWINITGVTQRGRFRLRDAGPGRTVVTFRLAYTLDGGLARPDRRPCCGPLGRPLARRKPEKPSAACGVVSS